MKTLLVIGILLILGGAILASNTGVSGAWAVQSGLIFLFGALAISKKEKIWTQAGLFFMVALFLWGFVNGIWRIHPLGAIISIIGGGWVIYSITRDKKYETENIHTPKILRTDLESQKRDTFEEIGRQFDAEKVSSAKATWLTMRGNNLSMRRRFEQAIKDFKEALQLEPNRVPTMISLGMAYSHHKNSHHKRMFKEAIDVLENVENLLKLADNPTYSTPLFNIEVHNLYYALGHSYFFIDDKEKAIQYLIKSLEAVEKLRILKESGVISEEEWGATQKILTPMVKNTKWLLTKIRI